MRTGHRWLAALLLASTSCATVFKGDQSSIRVTSEPVCAPVYVNGVPSGYTPVTLTLPSRNSYVVELRMPDHQPAAAATYSTLGAGWLLLDILCGIFPVIFDAATGAWYHNEPETLHFALRKGESLPNAYAPQQSMVEDCLDPARAAREAARSESEAQARCLEAAEAQPTPQLVTWALADCRSPRPPAPAKLSPSRRFGEKCTWSAECSPGLACPWGHCIEWKVAPAAR